MAREVIGVSDQPWPCANCEHTDYWDITPCGDGNPMAFCRHCTYGSYAREFGFAVRTSPEGTDMSDSGKCPYCGHPKLAHLTPGNWINGSVCQQGCDCQQHFRRPAVGGVGEQP